MIVNRRMFLISLLVVATSTTTTFARDVDNDYQQQHQEVRIGTVRGRNSNKEGIKQRRLHNSSKSMGKGSSGGSRSGGGGGPSSGGGGGGGGSSSNKPSDRVGSGGGGGLGTIPRTGTGATNTVAGNPLSGQNTQLCYNVPYDWKDDMQNDCNSYMSIDKCANAKQFVGEGKRSALDACCHCLGGTTGNNNSAVLPAQGGTGAIVIEAPNEEIVITPRVPDTTGNMNNGHGANPDGGNDCILNNRFCIVGVTCGFCCSGRYQHLPAKVLGTGEDALCIFVP